jgi:hypothetical protein
MARFKDSFAPRRLLPLISVLACVVFAQNGTESGYEREAKKREDLLSEKLIRLDEFITKKSVCPQLTEYSKLLKETVAESEGTEQAWNVYVAEEIKKIEVVLETAVDLNQNYDKEKSKIVNAAAKQQKELDDVLAREKNLPPDTPSDVRTKLAELRKTHEGSVARMKTVTEELEKERGIRKSLDEAHALIRKAYNLIRESKEAYLTAQRFLIRYRYQRPLDACIVSPNSPIRTQ